MGHYEDLCEEVGYEYTKDEVSEIERLDKEIDGMLFTLP
jgi:hypothetical protein